MRYSEIINESNNNIVIDTINRAEKLFSYSHIKVPLNGSLIFRSFNVTDVLEFPKNFTVHGDVDFRHNFQANITGDLIVKGNLFIHLNNKIIPLNMQIDKNLILYYSKTEEFTGNIKVNGSIFMPLDSTNVKFPSNTQIGGSIYIGPLTDDEAYDIYSDTELDNEEDVDIDYDAYNEIIDEYCHNFLILTPHLTHKVQPLYDREHLGDLIDEL